VGENAAFIIVLIYTLSIGAIMVFSIGQAVLVYQYLKGKKAKIGESQNPRKGYFPLVTLQLPVYNELYVVERLIDACCRLDYPIDKLEIQVLDDSTDETKEIIAKKVKEYQAKGVDISQVLRPNRVGYKAGALEYGLKQCKGEFIAIFDADFVPEPDFLMNTISQFSEDNIGMVQTRWEHLNLDYSLLTKVQGFGLDAHFTVEQAGRNFAGLYMNFNGTAGVWRKSCISDAGGWQHDTLTEDLDLSYRAQLKGWNFKYLEQFATPAELPAEMSAVKSQQFRWTKGAVETAKKVLRNVWKADIALKLKVFSTFHLLNSYVFIFIFLTGVLSVPLLVIKNQYPVYQTYFLFSSFFLLSFVVMIAFYMVSLSQRIQSKSGTFKRFLFLFPLFMSVSMGMAFHNSKAVIEGLRGKKSPFIRTPKFNVVAMSDKFSQNKYLSRKIEWGTVVETLLAFYYLGGIAIAVYFVDYGLLPFHLMLFLGFGIISYFSISHARLRN
jgi:cellulose synthase/poly-beta-1,6-N-acetylglucosamine synthase-like glycosyltransferase